MDLCIFTLKQHVNEPIRVDQRYESLLDWLDRKRIYENLAEFDIGKNKSKFVLLDHSPDDNSNINSLIDSISPLVPNSEQDCSVTWTVTLVKINCSFNTNKSKKYCVHFKIQYRWRREYVLKSCCLLSLHYEVYNSYSKLCQSKQRIPYRWEISLLPWVKKPNSYKNQLCSRYWKKYY